MHVNSGIKYPIALETVNKQLSVTLIPNPLHFELNSLASLTMQASDIILVAYKRVTSPIDSALSCCRPHTVIFSTCVVMVSLVYCYQTIFNKYTIYSLKYRLSHIGMRWMLSLPIIGKRLTQRLKSTRDDMRVAVKFK